MHMLKKYEIYNMQNGSDEEKNWKVNRNQKSSEKYCTEILFVSA